MTMPHLENCGHNESGWCLDCVKQLGEENMDLRNAVLEASRITFEHRHENGGLDCDELPDVITVKAGSIEQCMKVSVMIGNACRKWLI